MTIDVLQAAEDGELIPLAKLAKMLGKNKSTVIRWAVAGVRGAVLETAFMGAERVTTREAFDRFVAAQQGTQPEPPPPPKMMPPGDERMSALPESLRRTGSDMLDESYLTPPALAKLWGVNLRKVMHFIESGELPAINLALDPKGAKPRYRIRLSDIHAFEAGRMTVQSVIRQPPRPRQTRTEGVQFYRE